MAMRSRFIFFGLFILFVSTQLAVAQVAKPGVPLSVGTDFKEPTPILTLSPDLINRAKMKAQQIDRLKPYMFAWPADTIIDVISTGRETVLSDGSRVYRLGIESPGAYSLNLTFSKFIVPNGVNVFLYSPDMEVVRGAYSSHNNKKSGLLATTPVPGDVLFVEVNIPYGLLDFEPVIVIGRIAHDFANPFGFKTGFGKSGDCNVDINCLEGDEWQIEKRSVVKIIIGGSTLGTGVLINNTANDGRAIVLTANHVIANQVQAESSVYYFNYESAECGGSNGRLDQSISSSDVLATTSRLDFALLELSYSPPMDYIPYYAGWNRAVSSSNNNVTCIHHPSGDVKKITKALGVIVTGDFGYRYDENTHWLVPEWNVGTTEGGSSGSPLFDKDHKIIGDLTGGDAGCDYNYNDYFQKFFVCWDRYDEIDKQLKHWIDPLDNGAMVWNGYDPATAGYPLANFDYGASVPKVGKKIRFDDRTVGQPSVWEWNFEGATPSTSNLENPIVIFNGSGEFKVKLVVGNNFGKDSLTQTISIIDYTGFKADQNRIVSGASIQYTNLCSGDPISQYWEFEGGDPMDWFGTTPGIVRYLTPGTYNVSLVVEYPGFTDTLFYRDYVKVEPESLFFTGDPLRNIGEDEGADVIDLGEPGWIPGNNNLGINAFANAFLIESDTLRMATGLRIPIGKLPEAVRGSFLTAVIWDDDFNEIIKDSVEIVDFPFPDFQTIWFRHPVGIDSLIHAGFIVPDIEGGIFCSKIATPRSILEGGSAMARVNEIWMSLEEAAGLVTDLGITVETEMIFPDFKSQIKLNPVITNDKIYLDLKNLVFEKFNVQIYDIRGRQIISDYALTEKQLELQFIAPVSGMYFLVLELDRLSFTKKIMLIRNQ